MGVDHSTGGHQLNNMESSVGITVTPRMEYCDLTEQAKEKKIVVKEISQVPSFGANQ